MEKLMRAILLASLCVAAYPGFCLPVFPQDTNEQFFTVKTKNYTVETDVSAEYTQEIADLMETINKCYQSVFRSVAPKFAPSFRVRIFKKKADYLKMVGRVGEGSGAIFYATSPTEGTLASYVEGQPFSAMKENLYHEGFHQFLSVRIPLARTPLWLNEGLATLFQHSLRSGSKLDASVIGASRLGFLKKAVAERKTIPLAELMDMSYQQWNAGSNTTQFMYYCQSWMLVHFLAYSSKGKYQNALNKYIMLLHAGKPALSARIEAFGRDLSGLEQAWREYVLSCEPDPIYKCKEDLAHLAILVMVYQTKLQKRYEDIEEFREDLVGEKLKGWDLQMSDGSTVTSKDLDKIKSWFKCPCRQSKEEKSDYVFSRQRDPQCAYPDILCRWHKGTCLRAYWYTDPIDNKVKPDIIDEKPGARIGL